MIELVYKVVIIFIQEVPYGRPSIVSNSFIVFLLEKLVNHNLHVQCLEILMPCLVCFKRALNSLLQHTNDSIHIFETLV